MFCSSTRVVLFWPLLIASGLVWIRSRRALIAFMMAMTASSLAACIVLTAADAITAFYLLPTRAWEFGAGGLLSLALGQRRLPSRASVVIGWAGLALVSVSLVLISADSAFPGWLAVAPVVGTCAMLSAGAATPGAGVSALLSRPLLLRLGTLSYSWYLWHWPFLVFAQVLFPGLSPAGKVTAALLALMAAAASFRFVEDPLRHHPVLVRRPLLSVAAGLALTCVCFVGAVQARAFAQALAHSTRVVLFGDSHAIHWFNPIESIAEKRDWTLMTVLKSGCGAPDLDAGTPGSDRRDASCNAWRQRVHDGMRAALRALVANGLHVAVMRDVPRFVFDVPDCLAHASRLGRDVSRSCRGTLASNVNAEVFAAEQEAAAGLKGVSFVDTLSALCTQGVCETMAEGRVMYRDDNHLTGAFAETLEPVIEPQLAAALRGS